MNLRQLQPNYTNQQSFYGKAVTLRTDEGSLHLFSYNTEIAVADFDNRAIKLVSVDEDDYSRTTMRHLSEFAQQSARFSRGLGIKDVRNALAGDLIIKEEA